MRHSRHTGTRVHRVRARLQMRQSAGNNNEKMPCGIARKVEAAVLVKLLLEKAHLRVEDNACYNIVARVVGV